MTTPHDPYGQQGGQPQQPGYPQQGYPQQPGYPPAAPPLSPGEMQRPPRPQSVDTAFLLWLVGAGVGILSSIFALITAQAYAKAVAEQVLGRSIDSAVLDSAVASTSPAYGGTIFSIILFAVWIAIVFQMRNGANWARIVLAVLGGLGVIGGVVSLFTFGVLFSIGFFGVIQALFSLVSLAVTVGALIFMFKPDANHYFKAMG